MFYYCRDFYSETRRVFLSCAFNQGIRILASEQGKNIRTSRQCAIARNEATMAASFQKAERGIGGTGRNKMH
jgi:hypothetical protein